MPQNDVDGKAYYKFEFTAQAPNYIRHALGVVTVGNGMKLIMTCELEVRRFSFLARSLSNVVQLMETVIVNCPNRDF